jgi:hypothetical protein
MNRDTTLDPRNSASPMNANTSPIEVPISNVDTFPSGEAAIDCNIASIEIIMMSSITATPE